MSRLSRFGPFVSSAYEDKPNNLTNNTNCPDGIQWLYTILGECDITAREQASAYLGLASLFFWMLVGIPQIIKNFRNIDGMAGISFFLLFNWTTGDATNLIGCFLTGQLMSQIALGVYFVASDLVLLSQYAIFAVKRRRQRNEAKYGTNSSEVPRVILCLMGLFTMSHSLFGLLDMSEWPGNSVAGPASTRHLSRSLLSTNNDLLYRPEVLSVSGASEVLSDMNTSVHAGPAVIFWHNTKNIIGYVIGIISSIFYVGSRISQIGKNIKNQSTEGLSIFTFILAVFGNLTYGGQILARSLEGEFILEHTPWLVGSLGVVGLDLTLLGQFKYYSIKHRNLDEVRRTLLTHEYPINTDNAPIIESASAPLNGEII